MKGGGGSADEQEVCLVGSEFRKNPSFKSCCSGFFVELPGKGNVNFIKGVTEGEEGLCVCVCCDPMERAGPSVISLDFKCFKFFFVLFVF